MSENMGNKKRPPSKKASSGKKSGNKPKRPRPSGSKGQGVDLKKKNRLAGKTVEMSSGGQISMEEAMKDNAGKDAEKLFGNNLPEGSKGSHEHPSDPEEITDLALPGSPPELVEQISWKKQISSIVIWMFSVILLALTFFPGESVWTYVHNFILGILGFKAYLWAGLLVYFGYQLTKQRNEMDAMNIIRPTAGIIVLTDGILRQEPEVLRKLRC